MSWTDIEEDQIRYEEGKSSDIPPEHSEKRTKMRVLREESKHGD